MGSRTVVEIDKYSVGDGNPVCIVAELGVNHLGDFNRMKDMIRAAHEGGADLLKFQTYLAEKRYDPKANPKGQAFIDVLARWEFPRDQETHLWEYARSIGASVFTSPFDEESLDFADDMGSVAYKLAAFEIVNHKLVRAIAKKRKPVVISRGMANDDDISAATAILDEGGAPYVILHCISSYPTLKTDSHLRMIHTLRERYACPVGHSDHTRGTDIPPLAVAAGANMIEKHFTVNPKLRESDNPFSITPNELAEMVFKIRQVEKFMGRGDITKIDTESFMWDFRRYSD